MLAVSTSKVLLVVVSDTLCSGKFLTGSSLVAVKFKDGCGSRSFCFEISDTNRRVTWYAKEEWFGGEGVLGVSVGVSAHSPSTVSCLHHFAAA